MKREQRRLPARQLRAAESPALCSDPAAPPKTPGNVKKLTSAPDERFRKLNHGLGERVSVIFIFHFFGKLGWKLKLPTHCLRAVWPTRTFNVKACVFLKTQGDPAGSG